MAAFIMNCPFCGTALQVQDEWIGMETECPSCRQRFIIQKYPQMQPMQPMQQMQPMQPVYNPQMPMQQPNYAYPGSQTALAEANDDSNGCFVSLLWGGAALCWIAGFIFCFIAPVVSIVLLVVAFTMSLLSLALKKKGDPFMLMPGENILSTFRIKDCDDVTYYTRVTNLRLVLSAIEYPMLPVVAAAALEASAKPTEITFAWAWNEIVKIEVIREKVLLVTRQVMVIEDVGGGSYRFLKNDELLAFWNSVNRG